MKKQDLKKIINETIQEVLNESYDESTEIEMIKNLKLVVDKIAVEAKLKKDKDILHLAMRASGIVENLISMHEK
jgi:hypothetical protein